ncbi:MAG TPA: YicC family protein [Bacillota bacterium]|nr:YicC family protein [Clostridiales bacterium]HPT86132.1 YicC family protein [Bacillota bacterium]
MGKVMAKSMTAYGRATGSSGGMDFQVELKSVNSRYFDCTVKVPRNFGFLEEKVKARLQQAGITRGKIEVYIGIDIVESQNLELGLDTAFVASYIAALRRLRDEFGLADDITVMTVAQNRDIFTVKRVDEDAERTWEALLPVLDEAILAFDASRSTEGENLRRDMEDKMRRVEEIVERIGKKSAENITLYRTRLEERLRHTLDDLGVKADDARILTECAIFADKVAIDEELVRLKSHFSAFFDTMASTGPVGRRLDFLMQEINREVNTIGSKSFDAEISQLVVDCKCELEKIREQIQNIE